MSGMVWIGLIALVVALGLWSRFAPSIPAMVRRAARSGDLHSDAASKHRRAAGKDRSKAQAARDEADEQTD